MHGTYRGLVAVSRDVALDRFSEFVKRTLDAARARGMTDKQICAVTGLTSSTIHRWRRGDFGLRGPSADSVMKFADGMNVPRKTVGDLLGWSTDEAKVQEAEPQLPPDVRELLRRLRDPNVPEQEKQFIRETFKSLVSRPKPRVGVAKR